MRIGSYSYQSQNNKNRLGGGILSEEFENALQSMRDAGYKLTPQRKEILAYLMTHETHPTAEMIYQDLKNQDKSISLATVYNTLELLLKTQLVLAIDSDMDGKRHYDYFGHPHYHAICTNCGRIVDGRNFDLSQLPNIAVNETGFLIKGYEVTVEGLCPICQEKLGINN